MKLQDYAEKVPHFQPAEAHRHRQGALGLRKVGQTVVKEDNPCIRGQIFRCEAHGQGGRNQRIRRATS